MKKSFEKMTHEERVEAVRRLMKAGLSNKRTAKELGVKPGVVAGIRWRNKIPSKHPPGFKPRAKSPSGALLRLAINEARQCVAKTDGHQCGYERVEGSEYCALPAHRALEKRRERK